MRLRDVGDVVRNGVDILGLALGLGFTGCSCIDFSSIDNGQ